MALDTPEFVVLPNMEQSFALIIWLGITIFLAVVQVVVLTMIARGMMALKSATKKEDELVGETRQKSSTIITDAMSKANEILTDAEKQGHEVLNKEKRTAKILASQYEEHISQTERELREQFQKSTTEAEKTYLDFINSVQSMVKAHMDSNDKLIQERSAKLLSESQAMLEKHMTDVGIQIKKEVDAELATARGEVEEYKRHRLRVIDERIIDMLEDILQVALSKKLTFADQSDLVYKALEEAKRDNAFAQ